MTMQTAKALHCVVGLMVIGLLGLCLFPSRPANGQESGRVPDRRPFEGLKALVVEPENFWGWDAVAFGALEERGFEVTYAKPESLEEFSFLSQFDLVASNIKRNFSPKQVESLKRFVAESGALYGSWGGPMFTPDLLKVCHVASTNGRRHRRSEGLFRQDVGCAGAIRQGQDRCPGFCPRQREVLRQAGSGTGHDGQPAPLVARRPDKNRTTVVDGGSRSGPACSGGGAGGLSGRQAFGEARGKRGRFPQEGGGERERCRRRTRGHHPSDL